MTIPVIVDQHQPRSINIERGLVAQRNIREPRLNVNNSYLDVAARCYTSRSNFSSNDTIAKNQEGDVTKIALVDGVGTGDMPEITPDREAANILAENLVTKVVVPSEKTEPFATLEFENKKDLGCVLDVKGNKDCTVIVIKRNSKGEYDSENVKFAYYNPHNEKVAIQEPIEFLEEGSVVMAFTDGGLQAFFTDEVQKKLASFETENTIPRQNSELDDVLWGLKDNNESLRVLKSRMEPMVSALNQVGSEQVLRNVGAGLAMISQDSVADDMGHILARTK